MQNIISIHFVFQSSGFGNVMEVNFTNPERFSFYWDILPLG